jgi:hypothetical protein
MKYFYKILAYYPYRKKWLCIEHESTLKRAKARAKRLSRPGEKLKIEKISYKEDSKTTVGTLKIINGKWKIQKKSKT